MDRQFGVVMLMRGFYPLTGGYQNQALRLAQEMIKRGIRIFVLTQRHTTLPPQEVYRQVPIFRVFAFPRSHLAAFSYLLSSFIWMFKNRHQFDLIHANRSSSGLVAGLIGFILRKKVLYKLTRGDEIEIKGFKSNWYGRLKVFCLRQTVNKFVAITNQIEKDLKGLGVRPIQVSKIPNGISLNGVSRSYDPGRIKTGLGWGPQTKVVTFVGRLVHAKGLDWLLEIWREVSRQEKAARLLIVGDGAERPALEAQAQALGIADTVAFVGNQKDVFQFLAISDLFVLPSRKEGIANALLEAMSQKLPVVVADDILGGNREVVTDGQDGFVVKLGDDAALAQALLTLLRDESLRQEMGKKARATIEKRFSIESVADRYCGVYHELLRGE